MTQWDWTRVVFDHVKIGVRDAAASKAFYRTVLAPLGIPPLWEGDQGAQFANLVVSGNAEPGREQTGAPAAPVLTRIPGSLNPKTGSVAAITVC